MKKYIQKFIDNISDSLKTDKAGDSARKLSALTIIIMVVVLHIKWFKSEHWEFITEVLALDFTFILCCLGLATWQQIKEMKTPPKDESKPES